MIDESIRSRYRVVIGLEVHAQLLTESKMYASDSTEYGAFPNTHISAITLGHPGTLPKVNKKAVEYAMKMGMATESKIARYNIFDRKNYFYPDLPKGYQVTQDKTPICAEGKMHITLKDGTKKVIELTRIHIEEDAGKLIHVEDTPDTLVDFNRAGVPLIEIVTEPVISSSGEAYAFLTEARKLVRYLDICDGNMEEGSMRCDANVSVMKKTDTEFGKKIEIKNMNSIRNVARAIEHEIDRQIAEIEKGTVLSSETRTFDAVTGTTASMRTKEALNDYRYFPEPDLCPLEISDEWLESVKAGMPALPHELYAKFVEEFGLSEYDANVLTDSKEVALYFDDLCQKTSNFKAASNWVMGPVKSYLNELTLKVRDFPVGTGQIAEIIQMVDENKISFSSASQRLFAYLTENKGASPAKAAEKLNLIQDSNEDSIKPVVEEVINAFPGKVAEYRKGKKGLLGMFMGEVMKKTKGKVDPKVANQLVRQALEN